MKPPPPSQPGLFDKPARRARSQLKGCRQTSREAQRSVRGDVQRYRDSVLSFIRGMGVHGATDDEMQDRIPMNPSTQRPRRGELAQDGLIVRTGEKRLTRTGRRADVWVAKEFATGELEERPAPAQGSAPGCGAKTEVRNT